MDGVGGWLVGLACVCVVVDAGAGRVGRVRVRRAGVGVGWCGRGVVGVVRRIGLGEGGELTQQMLNQ